MPICICSEFPDLFQPVCETVRFLGPSPLVLPGSIPDCSAGSRIVIPFMVFHQIHPNTSRSTSLIPVLWKDSTPT